MGYQNKKKRRWIVLTALLLVVGGYLSYHIYYAYNTGTRYGQVVDAETGKPVEGAIIDYIWKTPGFLGVAGPHLAAFVEVNTDKEGKYYIPNQFYKPKIITDTITYEKMMVYKFGYSFYSTNYDYDKIFGRSFIDFDKKQKYRKHNNIVKLSPWKKDKSHENHMKYIETDILLGGGTGVLMREELEKERMVIQKEKPKKNK